MRCAADTTPSVLTGPIVVADDGTHAADAAAFAETLAAETGFEVVVEHAHSDLRLLRAARRPVAVVPAGWASDPHPLRVVGVAFDGRPESRLALDLGRELAERAEATMRVIAVAHPVTAAQSDVPAHATHDTLAERLHDTVASLPSSLRALPVLEHGGPADVLVDESAKGLDVLVCGSRGLGAVGAVVLGSVSRELLRWSQCPVLVVPRATATIP